jgi:hypothetical protein
LINMIRPLKGLIRPFKGLIIEHSLRGVLLEGGATAVCRNPTFAVNASIRYFFQ